MATAKTRTSKVAEWASGASGFLQWLEDIQPRIPSAKGGYTRYELPSEHIKNEITTALDGNYSTVVLCWPRRHGKTVVAALVIAWRFLTRRTQNIAIVANSVTQSVDTAFRLVRTILEQTPYTADLIKQGHIQVRDTKITYPSLGNVIQGFPANSSVLYGKKLSIAQVSELHAARDDTVFQTLASATIDSDDGLVLVDSTVGARSSPLYGLHNVADRGDDPTLFFSYIAYRDVEDAIANSPDWIQPQRLRSRHAQMLPAEFAQQHLNQWITGSNALFPREIIDRCRDFYVLDPESIAEGRAYTVGGGLDRAYGFSMHGDSTVTTAVMKVLDGEDEQYYVLASDRVSFSSARGIKHNFTRYNRDLGMSRAALEHYNAQDIASWAADQHFDHEVVSPTAERQSNAFTAIYSAAREGRLHIHPTFERLLKEMESFEYEIKQAGNGVGNMPKFGAASGAHDDHVYSLAWAIYALRHIELNPYEIAGIHCNATGPVVQLCALNGGDMSPPCADSCRSFQEAWKLYQRHRERAGAAPLSFDDFAATKLTNTGAHTFKR